MEGNRCGSSGRRILTTLISALFVAGPSAVSSGAQEAAPPAGDISDNVEFITNIPEMASAISINFIGDTMFVSTATGIYSYDVSDPAAPARLGALPMYIWENEDVDLDAERQLLFISRDPRGFTSPATPGAFFPYGAVHIIDVSNPAAPDTGERLHRAGRSHHHVRQSMRLRLDRRPVRQRPDAARLRRPPGLRDGRDATR